jgi:beta-lactamase regulating signal transducer with metallopeptidase domain
MMQITQIMNVFALALVHFAWIATIIGIAVVTTRRLISPTPEMAQWRYRVGMAGMVAMLLAIGISGWLAWSAIDITNNRSTIASSADLVPPSGNQEDFRQTALKPRVNRDDPDQAAHWAENNKVTATGIDQTFPSYVQDGTQTGQWTIGSFSPWIALTYILGLVIMLLRFCAMLIGCRRILNQSETFSNPQLGDVISRYARQFKLACIPALATCQRITSPVIVGFWKPVILIPSAMLSGLTTTEIEIVLWHELAHFRRLDPMMVFFQRSMETILFFHPAVWLISRNLDRDREICCDEMVLATGASRIEYASVLCRVAEFAIAKPNALGLAVAGSSSKELVTRVGMILGKNVKRADSRRSWSILFVAGTVIVFVAGLLVSNSPFGFSTGVVTQENEQSEKGSKQDEGKSENTDGSEQDPGTDKYDVTSDDFKRDYARGFEVISKLLAEAEAENGPAETIAKLSYHAASLHYSTQLNRPDELSKDFSISIRILKKVVDNPQDFLLNKRAGALYRNCVIMLAGVYEQDGEPTNFIDSLYQTAIEDIDSAMRLEVRDRFLLTTSLQVYQSDHALHAKDWPRAIELVQPVVDQVDEFLKDAEGARHISMAVRQQSMFLANNNEVEKSAALIDSICEKLEHAPALDEASKISHQCLLRGKNLINFDQSQYPELFEKGWENYQTLAKRAKSYAGDKRADVLRACINMDRLALGQLSAEKADQAIKLVHETMALIDAHPEMQDPKFGVLSYLKDMCRMTLPKVRYAGKLESGDPFPPDYPHDSAAKQLDEEVKAFVAKYDKDRD